MSVGLRKMHTYTHTTATLHTPHLRLMGILPFAAPSLCAFLPNKNLHNHWTLNRQKKKLVLFSSSLNMCSILQLDLFHCCTPLYTAHHHVMCHLTCPWLPPSVCHSAFLLPTYTAFSTASSHYYMPAFSYHTAISCAHQGRTARLRFTPASHTCSMPHAYTCMPSSSILSAHLLAQAEDTVDGQTGNGGINISCTIVHYVAWQNM